MPAQRAKIRQLQPHLYLIDDAGESTCYLLCGSEKAALIDTANGRENLRAIVETLTGLPVMVINTHGHGDHIYGNLYFEEAWMHPDDNALAEESYGYARAALAEAGQPMPPIPPFRPLQVGDVIELGGLTLEVVSLRGHTAGSIGLLDKVDRLLFTGDGLNTHIWMQLDHSLSIAVLRDSLVALKEQHGGDFDRVLHGHARDYEDKAILDQMIAGCEELLAGRRAEDLPYRWFGGECLQHPLSDRPGHVIVYTEDKL